MPGARAWFRGAVCVRLGFGGLGDLIDGAAVFGAGGIEVRFSPVGVDAGGLVGCAGMGVLVQPRSMAPAGLTEIAPGWLPALEDVEFVLVPRKGADQLLVNALSEDILAKVRGPRPT